MSKGLKALERIKGFMSQNCKHWKQDTGYIEQELKAFEIIKEKEIDIGSLVYYIKNSNHALAFYNGGVVNEKKKLTKEEFDLLKEELK